jgi:hypothetical protein
MGLPSPPKIQKLHQIRVNASILGAAIPIVLGQERVTAKLIWYGDFTAKQAKQGGAGGKGLSKGGTSYVYHASVMAALAMGPINYLLSVWDQTGRFKVDSASESYVPTTPYKYTTVNAGSFASDLVPHVVTAYSYPGITDYGSPGSVTLAGSTNVPMTLVPGGTVATDNFPGSALSSSWGIQVGTFAVSANAVTCTGVGASQNGSTYFHGLTFNPDQNASIQIVVPPTGGEDLGVTVRASSSAETYYGFLVDSNEWFCFKMVAGTGTILNSGPYIPQSGDVLYLSVVGTTLTCKINGDIICVKTDSTIATGTPGFSFGLAGAASLTNFACGGGVGPSLSAGQYAVDPTTGIYTFASADAGKNIVVNYSFYRYRIVTEELTVVPFSGPYTVTVDNSATFRSDDGVQYYPAGIALVPVGSSPSKGQYSRSGGTYTFAAADSGAGIVISYEFQDPVSDNNAPNQINLTLIGGAKGQQPWSYLTSRHQSQALGYTQLAIIASSAIYLGYTPELPNYNYELAGAYQFGGGVVDVNPADAITAILSDPAYGVGFPLSSIGSLALARACWTAYSFFISVLLENQQSAASVVGQWLEAGMVAAYWSEGLLKFVPYCDTSAVGNGVLYQPPTTPVADLTDDDFVSGSSADEPVKMSCSVWPDRWNRVQVEYNARVNDYNPEIAYEEDFGSIQRYGKRVEDPVTWSFIKTLTAAQYAASMRLQRYVAIANTYQFTLPASFSFLEPMDIVTVTDQNLNLTGTPVRITQISDDPVRGLDVTAEDWIWGTAAPAYNPKTVNTPSLADAGTQDPGNATAVLFEAPNRLQLQSGNEIWGFINGSNPNWGGCHVWLSYDGLSYALLKDQNGKVIVVSGPARIGALTSTLASSSAQPDSTNTLAVQMETATPLPSVSSSQAVQGISMCAVCNTDGTHFELISYQNSVINPAVMDGYNLTTLYRAQYTTTGQSHAAGSLFARLDQASFVYQYDPSYYGKTVFVKFTSFNLLGNNEQSLAAVPAYSFVLAGSGKGAVALDTGNILVQTPGYTQFRPLSNPLSAHDAGSSATISIANFYVRIAGVASDQNFNSGSIVGLSYNTLYYVYFDQPPPYGLGGSISPSYQATTVKETALNGPFRFLVGSIQTPVQGQPDTVGNNDGGNTAGSGAQFIYRMSNVYQRVAGSSTVTNPQNSLDGTETTFAKLAGTASGASNAGAVVLYGPPALELKFTSATLYVVYGIPVNSLNNGAANILQLFGCVIFDAAANGDSVLYNFIDGTSLNVNYTAGAGAVAKVTASIAIPPGQNLSTVAAVLRANLYTGGSYPTAGSYEIDIYDAFIAVID